MTGAVGDFVSQSIPNVPYANFAKSIELNAISFDDPEQLGSAWDAAPAADRPTLIEVKTDPEVPRLSLHIINEEAAKFICPIAKGNTGGRRRLVESARPLFSRVLPGDEN